MVAHKAACHTLSEAFLKIQIRLMLEVLFSQNSKVEDLFCGALSGALNPAFSSVIISSAWGLSMFKMTFSMTLLE